MLEEVSKLKETGLSNVCHPAFSAIPLIGLLMKYKGLRFIPLITQMSSGLACATLIILGKPVSG